MLKVKLQTADGRREVIVEPDQTPIEIFEQEEVSLEGATVSLNGVPMSIMDMNENFADLLMDEASATLSVVVKLENAGV